ncbi:MAG: hypothetical protein WAM14_17935 [Candidatus Nitrosopolaris sp.]
MLEVQKTKSTNDVLKLNRIIDEFQGTLGMYKSSLPQKRGEMTYMNQDSSRLQRPINYNTDNLYAVAHLETDASSYSIRLSYMAMNG